MGLIVGMLVSTTAFGEEKKTASADAGAGVSAKIMALHKGWVLETQTLGDLNGDSTQDVVAVLKRTSKKEDEPLEALLVVYFVDKAGSLSKALEAPHVLCFECGGIKGAPLPFEFEIKNKVLGIRYEGGSREAFSHLTKWRYQNGGFFLIGSTHSSQDSLADKKDMIATITRDANVLSGKMIEKIETNLESVGEELPKTKSKELKCKIKATYKTMQLQNFKFQEFEGPQCSPAALE